MIDVETQLKKAIAAVTALGQAGVEVLEVLLSRETNAPFILISSKDAADIILTGKIQVKPGTYDRHMTGAGFISETYKVEYMGCVVSFTFLSLPRYTKKQDHVRVLN